MNARPEKCTPKPKKLMPKTSEIHPRSDNYCCTSTGQRLYPVVEPRWTATPPLFASRGCIWHARQKKAKPLLNEKGETDEDDQTVHRLPPFASVCNACSRRQGIRSVEWTVSRRESGQFQGLNAAGSVKNDTCQFLGPYGKPHATQPEWLLGFVLCGMAFRLGTRRLE